MPPVRLKLPKLHFNVAVKVAGMVVAFEGILLLAYGILTNFFVDQQRLVEVIHVSEQNILVGTVISTLVLAGYLTFLVVVRIFSPVSVLARGTEEIIKGNLDLKLELKTGDELEVLAERFNAMAAALKAERESLENKVKERTRALEEAKKHEEARMQDLLKLRDEFLFVAAHEIRTPTAAIRWSLESIQGAKKMTADVRQAMEDAMTSSKNLAALVEDLLNMARLEGNRIEFAREPVDIIDLVGETAKDLAPIAEKRKVKLVIEMTGGPTAHALVDRRRLKEVLVNLTGNAIKFNKAGGHVAIKAGMAGDKVRISVEDDGPGIEREEQRHLFEKFWRSPEQKNVEGTGLGLFITKRLVEGMNGSIGFESASGKGTTFTVLLPATK